LGQCRYGANLDETETKPGNGFYCDGILVEAAGQSHRVGKDKGTNPDLQPVVLHSKESLQDSFKGLEHVHTMRRVKSAKGIEENRTLCAMRLALSKTGVIPKAHEKVAFGARPYLLIHTRIRCLIRRFSRRIQVKKNGLSSVGGVRSNVLRAI
jgi:hypothetical protein